jgi:hypothetical protein
MEIPLSLKKTADGRLVYGIPLWYRIMTGAMIALVLGGMLTTADSPSLIAWLILILLALGTLYEEIWIVDPKAGTIRHLDGIWPIARASVLSFDDVEEFALGAFARGTVPGSTEESADKDRAFDMMNHKDTQDIGRKGFIKQGARKPYINLLLRTKSGETYLVDTLPARRAYRLKKAGEALAEACGSHFSDRN